jgi:hypothetical protein
MGSDVSWQDSGFFLAAVKELGILYPPGFPLYLLACKAWTQVFFFLDFVVAVHLFSAFFAALAAGTLASACRDLLSARGALFKVLEAPEAPRVAWSSVGAGCLAACGYTFWQSGIYAKGYSLYYWVLAVLLKTLIRAAETGRPRDFTGVAVLIGLAWQVHPSATNLGLALVLYVLYHFRAVGPKGVAGRVGLAALCAAGPSVVLLPVFAAREPLLAFGNPRTPGEILDYLLGRRFMAGYAFGFDGSRWASIGRYSWEEMLAVGLAAAAAGIAFVSRVNRPLLLGLIAWTVPVFSVTALFKLEGQHDFWFVAAWIPLYMIAALGLYRFSLWARGAWKPALAGAVAGGVAWAVAVNAPLLSQRGNGLPRTYGRMLLEKIHQIDGQAIVLLAGDEPLAITSYVQIVRGQYPGILAVSVPDLGDRPDGKPGWLDVRLRARHPFLRVPDYAGFRGRFPYAPGYTGSAGAFANANANAGRPLFLDFRLPDAMVRPDYVQVPAGPFWKLVPRGSEEVNPAYWEFPVEPSAVRARFRRARGQAVSFSGGRLAVEPEPYERRLYGRLLGARQNLAGHYMSGRDFAAAKRVYEGLEREAPEVLEAPAASFGYATALCEAGEEGRAVPFLLRAAGSKEDPGVRVGALVILGGIYRKQGKEEEARRSFQEALRTWGLAPEVRSQIEELLRQR